MATDIRARVDAFVNELEGLIREAIREGFEAAMGGGGGGSRGGARGGRRGPGRPPKAASGGGGGGGAGPVARAARKKGQKRSPAELAAVESALFAYIQKNPGKRIEEINSVLKVPTKELSRPLSKLMAAKKVRRQGQKRASRYFPTGR